MFSNLKLTGTPPSLKIKFEKILWNYDPILNCHTHSKKFMFICADVVSGRVSKSGKVYCVAISHKKSFINKGWIIIMIHASCYLFAFSQKYPLCYFYLNFPFPAPLNPYILLENSIPLRQVRSQIIHKWITNPKSFRSRARADHL